MTAEGGYSPKDDGGLAWRDGMNQGGRVSERLAGLAPCPSRGSGRSALEKVHRTFSFAYANRSSPHKGRVEKNQWSAVFTSSAIFSQAAFAAGTTPVMAVKVWARLSSQREVTGTPAAFSLSA